MGHRFVEEIFDGPVLIQEKLDGSQFSFGKLNGVVHFRSKNQPIDPADPGMFRAGVESVMAIDPDLLPEGWTFRGEYLRIPKHNTLTYDRVPRGHIALFDVDKGHEDYLQPNEAGIRPDGVRVIHYPAARWAEKLGLDYVPLYHFGPVGDVAQLHDLLERASVLGGTEPIEGIVIKNYDRIGPDGKVMMAKLVRPSFKERNAKTHKVTTKGDIVEALVANFNPEARWLKAVQRRRDSGDLVYAPQDIGMLIKDLSADFTEEEQTEIAEALTRHFLPIVIKKLNGGFAEWYKAQLALGTLDQELREEGLLS